MVLRRGIRDSDSVAPLRTPHTWRSSLPPASSDARLRGEGDLMHVCHRFRWQQAPPHALICVRIKLRGLNVSPLNAEPPPLRTPHTWRSSLPSTISDACFRGGGSGLEIQSPKFDTHTHKRIMTHTMTCTDAGFRGGDSGLRGEKFSPRRLTRTQIRACGGAFGHLNRRVSALFFFLLMTLEPGAE